MRHFHSICIVVSCFSAAASAQSGSPQFAAPFLAGTVRVGSLNEVSGLVASRRSPGVLWSHNDSGDSARIFAIDTDGRGLGTLTLTGALAIDFEDIAIGPGPTNGLDYLYVGDIGDNLAIRSTITVHRITEPQVSLLSAVSGAGSGPAIPTPARTSISLRYPDGARDAEALLVDPLSGDLFLFTKADGSSRVYRAPAASIASPTGTITLSFLRTISIPSGQRVTAADISPDGNWILLRGLSFARLWRRDAGQTVSDAVAGAVGAGNCWAVPVVGNPTEPQGESICFDWTGSGYFTVSEGSFQPIYYARRTGGEGPSTPCDSLDFNRDGNIDPADIDSYFSVLADGPCAAVPRQCSDLDFNNDGAIEPADVDSYFRILGEGPCH